MRFWEIDLLRGVAIVFMVIFNYAFALDYLHIYTITSGWGFWWLFPRVVAGTFILVSGIAAYISYQKKKNSTHRIKRGAVIFGWGLALTAATFLLVPSATIWFGILHLIGLSVMISPLFMKLGRKNLIIGLALALIGFYLNNPIVDTPLLMPLGFLPPNFTTLDYFPLLPWFGVFLIGLFIGEKLYTKGKRRFKIKEPRFEIINLFGRHSLFIYLIHQVVLLFVLYSLGLIGVF